MFCISLDYVWTIKEYRRGNQKKDNPEKLAKQSTQDEEKQNKDTTQYGLNTTIYGNKHK